MSALRRRFAVTVAFFAALLAMPALTTSANAYPDGQIAGVTISASAAAQGCTLTVSGTNFFGTVTFSSGGTSLGTATAGADGSFSKGITLDSGIFSQGSQSILVQDTVGDSATVTFTVTAPGTGCNGTSGGSTGGSDTGSIGSLSNTGVAVIGIGTVGGILLAGGGLMLLAGRRRKATA